MRASLILLVPALSLCGCGRVIAERFVRAPNTTREYADLVLQTGGEEIARVWDRELRIDVGPPPASLSVAVIEPYAAGVESLSVPRDGREGGRFEIYRTSAAASRPAADAKGTVFVLHGLYDRKGSAFSVLWAAVFSQAGYRVVLVDLRGHGHSTGKWITYGAVESKDLIQVADALDAQGLITGRVGAFGISYGAATAIQWAAADPRVAAVVAFAPFDTLENAAADFVPQALGKWRRLISPADLRAAMRWAGRLADFDPAEASPLRAIAQTRAPVLLVHGTADEHLPPAHSQRLHAAAPDHSELFLVEGADHVSLLFVPVELLRVKSVGWFGRWLGRAGGTH